MKVRCNNCGKMVPYQGTVCPFCQADKSDAKKRLEQVGVWGVGGAAIAAVAALIFTGAPIPVAGCLAFGGFIIGAAVGSAVVAVKG